MAVPVLETVADGESVALPAAAVPDGEGEALLAVDGDREGGGVAEGVGLARREAVLVAVAAGVCVVVAVAGVVGSRDRVALPWQCSSRGA